MADEGLSGHEIPEEPADVAAKAHVDDITYTCVYVLLYDICIYT